MPWLSQYTIQVTVHIHTYQPATYIDHDSPGTTELRSSCPVLSQLAVWPSSPHFTDKETEAQRNDMPGSRSLRASNS